MLMKEFKELIKDIPDNAIIWIDDFDDYNKIVITRLDLPIEERDLIIEL